MNVDNGPMDERDGELERLSEMLEALGSGTDAMTVGEMDGFVTGLALFPERVGHREWLPRVLGSEPRFDSPEEAAAVEAALIGHYSRVAGTLAHEPDNYGPALEVGEDTEQVFWQPWVFGFARAMRLRPGAWARIEGSNELDVQEAVQAIQTLYAAADGSSALAVEGLELLDSMGPAMIAGIVRDLNASRVSGSAAGELARNGSREVTMGTGDETGEVAEVLEWMGDLRRQLLDRLEGRDDRQDRHMVALIDALQELRMHPGDALHAVVWILVAINPESTRDELARMAAGISDVRRREKEEAEAFRGSAGVH